MAIFNALILLQNFGAGDGIRTHDPNLGKVVPGLCAELSAPVEVCKNPLNSMAFPCRPLPLFARTCAELLAMC
jgi:hypothetical protein